MSTVKEIISIGEIESDIKRVKDLWSEVINKYNDDIFPHTTIYHDFLCNTERSKVARDIFRNLDIYVGIIKKYYYMELHKHPKIINENVENNNHKNKIKVKKNE